MRRLLPALALFLTLIALPANASITLAQSHSHTSSGAVTSDSVTASGAISSTALLIVGVDWGNSTPASYSGYTVSDTNSLTWTPCNSAPVAQGNSIACFFALDTTGHSSTTVTVSISGGGSHTLREAVYEYDSSTGWIASPVDTSNTGFSSTSVQAGNGGPVTPSTSGELVWTAIQILTAGATSITGTGGCTERPTSEGSTGNGWSSGGRADVCDIQSSGNTSVTPGFTWLSISSTYSAISVVFKTAAAAPHKVVHRVTQD